MTDDDPALANDPGWRPVLRGTLGIGILLPGLAIHRRKKLAKNGDGLIALRLLFVSFSIAFILIGVVVAILAATGGLDGDVDIGLTIAGVVTVGLVSLGAIRWLRPALDCTNQESLAASYSTRFFLRVAVSEAAALAGFVGFILAGNPMLYPIGLVFTAVGFTVIAPTAANLARDQTRLTLGGCGRNLVADLRRGSSG